MVISLLQQEALNSQFPEIGGVGLGTILKNLEAGPNLGALSLYFNGNLGHDAGAASDGVLFGSLTERVLTKFLMSSQAHAVLAIADDGGAYTVETTGANDATANNMTLLPAAAAENDAYYIGHGTKKFGAVDLVIGTKGDFVGTVALEYWDSVAEAWTACVDGVDGTAAFTADPGTVQITHTAAETWGKCLVDGTLGYWLRIRVTAATSGGGALGTRAYAIVAAADATFTDDTTDINDAGAGDVDLLPTYPVVGDAAYFGGGATTFCKLVLTVSTALTGESTRTWELWDGDSWEAMPSAFEDASAGFSTGAAAYVVSFKPPDWWVPCTAENGPGGQAGYFIRCRLSALTSYTAQPKATIAKLKGFAGTGLKMPKACTITRIQGTAATLSAANGDSRFLLVNVTTGRVAEVTWTKATAILDQAVSLVVGASDQVALVQVAEDGATEFAAVNFILTQTAA